MESSSEHNNGKEVVELYSNGGPEKAQWGWNWLERWMSTQPYNTRQLGPNEASYMTLTTTTTTTDDMLSEKTVEMDAATPTNTGMFVRDMFDPTRQHRHSGSRNVPSYMAPTQSAKAKVRSQGVVKQRSPTVSGPQWNSSTKKSSEAGLGCDSSSSGGGTTTTTPYQVPRSPGPSNIGAKAQSRRVTGMSPEATSGGEYWRLPFASRGWRHDYE